MSTRNNRKVSRRDFLKKVGAGAAALVTAQLLTGQTHPAWAAEAATKETWGILIDLTRCAGCNSCALACKASNSLPNANVEPLALDSDTYTCVETHRLTTTSGDVENRYIKQQCMHCLNAACVAACPAAAMYKSEMGAVIYRPERCLGCRYCQLACPFGIPRFEWKNGVTPVISKCWLCYNRLQKGQKPACVEACPTGALRFGQRDKLLAQAHAQIVSNPGHYVEHVFGEFEAGGTSMLYLSDIPFEELGFPVDLPHTAPPEETEKIMAILPAVITGLTALMAGTALYTHRERTTSGRESKEPAAGPAPLVSGDEQEE
jgi:formate dehydrogenase iron-sulfur subunit